MNFIQIKERERAAAEVRAFMHRHRIAVADLIEIGGEDLSSANSGKAERARHVGQCWQMMARLEVSFLELEDDENASR